MLGFWWFIINSKLLLKVWIWEGRMSQTASIPSVPGSPQNSEGSPGNIEKWGSGWGFKIKRLKMRRGTSFVSFPKVWFCLQSWHIPCSTLRGKRGSVPRWARTFREASCKDLRGEMVAVLELLLPPFSMGFGCCKRYNRVNNWMSLKIVFWQSWNQTG